MTMFDTETDRYLERVGADGTSGGGWEEVLERAHRRGRAARRAQVAAGGGVAVAVAALALAALGAPGGDSLLEKAEAAVLAPVRAADGTIEHVRVQYRQQDGAPFAEYETWLAADGAWCRRTLEGLPGGQAPDSRLTLCRSADRIVDLYLPASGEILRTRPGAASEAPAENGGDRRGYTVVPAKPARGSRPAEPAELEIGAAKGAAPRAGAPVDLGPTPGWLTDDIVDDFRRHAVREAGEMTLDGRTYAKFVTEGGGDAVLVDRDTGEAVAWIPSALAFGVPTIVVRTRQALPEDAHSLSLPELHPEAVVREVSAAERDRAIEAQFARG